MTTTKHRPVRLEPRPAPRQAVHRAHDGSVVLVVACSGCRPCGTALPEGRRQCFACRAEAAGRVVRW